MFIETSSEDDLGIEIQVLTCTIHKNKKNMIGVTLGGGHPKCPCIYIERVLHEGPADLDGNLKAGFEILRVNGLCVKGWSVRQVSSVIRENETSEVAIKYKKLIIDKKSYNNLDIDLSINKLKHKFAEKFGPNISDFLGLRRAVLIHDPLISKLSYLYKLTRFYCKLILLLKKFETSSRNMIETQKEFGNSLADMAARDPQKSANEAFNQFGEAHRQIAKRGEDILSVLSESAASTKTFNTTILPDLKMTVRKYSQVKCEYLAYCVKAADLESEVSLYSSLGEDLLRVETGDYEYRVILHLREDALSRLRKMRSDVVEKLELADKKHVDGLYKNVRTMTESMIATYSDCCQIMEDCIGIFPIEPDLKVVTNTNA